MTTIDAVQDRRLKGAGDDYEDKYRPDWAAELQEMCEPHNCHFRGIADRDDGSGALLFVWRPAENYEAYFTTGFFATIDEAIEFSVSVFETFSTEEIEMNIYKSNKLFPHIRGVMLKEKRVTLTMNGKVKIVEMREGNDARVELFFTDHAKSAVINRTQSMDIADIYGPETDDWEGKPVTLYGEHGTWFGRETWGLRVDKQATMKEWNQVQRQMKEAAKQVNGSGADEEE